MRKPRSIGLGAKAMDDDSRAIIYDGASISQLGSLFELDNREVTRRIRNVAPCGDRLGYPIYAIKDAAPFLVPPQGDIEDAIKRMSPKDLPAALSKEFWSAQHARLKFEEDLADLWRTDTIIELLSETFKTLRMTILLIQDQLEKESQLSEHQRGTIRSIVDGLLNDLADSLVERFKDERNREFDRDEAEGL